MFLAIKRILEVNIYSNVVSLFTEGKCVILFYSFHNSLTITFYLMLTSFLFSPYPTDFSPPN